MKFLKRLKNSKLINPPKFLLDNTIYLTKMGSTAYGVNTDTSDIDFYGIVIPPKVDIFPHLLGEIPGFGTQTTLFKQWQHHHVLDKDLKKEYDFSIFSIVKYFDLYMKGNPNMVDSLFTPRACVVHSTQISEHLRENRHLFLSKAMVPKFLGYAFSQISKIRAKAPLEQSNRYESYVKHGYDLKYAYHSIRLLCEIEQILEECTLDLQRNKALLKSIRAGECTLEQVEAFFTKKESLLEKLKLHSSLREVPSENDIKVLLMECLEMHYGSLSECVTIVPDIEKDIKTIDKITEKYI